jgi:hypothetical protein
MAEIKVTGKLIPTPRKPANIYRLKTPNVTERALRTLAKQMGMTADAKSATLCSSADTLIWSEGHLELTAYRASGAIRFVDRSRWQVDDRKSNLKIQDGIASRLALDLVKQMKLFPAREMQFLKAARLKVGEATRAGKEATERTIDVAVALQRLVDKIPVDGPGGKIIVYLDAQRSMSGLEIIWRQLGAVYRRNVPCRSPEAALRDLAAHYRSKEGIIEIENVRYGYFEEGWKGTQQYLQPAYIFFGVLSSPDGTVRKRMIYVATALTNPAGRITPPLKRKPPQRSRSSR